MSKAEGQGTAFLVWVVGGVLALFLLRHPAGRQLLAGPGAGVGLAGVLTLLGLGWSIGWPARARWLGVTLAAGALLLGVVLPLGKAGALLLAGGLPLGFYLYPLRAGRSLPAIRLPALRLPRPSLRLAWPTVRPSDRPPAAPPAAAATEPAEIPDWTEHSWPEQEEGGVRPGIEPALLTPTAEKLARPDEELPSLDEEERLFTAVPPEEELEPGLLPTRPAILPQVPLSTEEAGPPQAVLSPAALALASRDPAVALAAKVLALLHEKSLDPPFLHLVSGGAGDTALDVHLANPRRQGEAISALAPLFSQELGAVPGATLRGQTLRLSFPAYARGREPVYGESSLWVPLGRTAQGQRMLANLLGLETLLLLGEEPAPLVAAVHTMIGAALAGTLSRRPPLLLAEESGHYLDSYRGQPGVTLYSGAEAVAHLNQYVLDERSYKKITRPPLLAVVLLPSVGALAQVTTLLEAGPAAGVYPVVAVDTPELWPVQALAARVRARLVFHVRAEVGRFYLAQTGAERLGEYQALYHLTETMWDPEVLMSYAAEEEDVQGLLRSLGEEQPAGASNPPGEPLPAEILAILEAVLEIGRYSVRQVYERVQALGVTRQVVLETEGVFEDAGVVERPANRLGRRKVVVHDREEALVRLREYLEGQS